MTPPRRSVDVDALRHLDKRRNIPTDELAAFVTDEDLAPVPVHYPRWRTARDQALDPQLVWRGKDERDGGDDVLEVASLPVYIQEKVHPRAIIEALRRSAPAEELTLFSDFNGIDFDELVDFYRHEQNWSNRLILGDALLVMTSLAEKEQLKGKVQMIFMDPPYGVNFRSNWQASTDSRDVKDGRLEDVTRQPEQIRAFRDTWKNGIHTYLDYLRDRLTVGRELLADSGSIFVQMGDENVHLVRTLLDEVFGADNFVSQIAFTKAPGGLEAAGRMGSRLDYLLWYARDGSKARYQPLFEPRPKREAIEDGFSWIEFADGTRRRLARDERAGRASLPDDVRLFMDVSLTKPGPGAKYDIEFDGQTYNSGRRWWGMPKESLARLIAFGRVFPVGRNLRFVRYLDDFPFRKISNVWTGLGGASDPIYVVQTNDEVVKRCMLMVTEPGDLVLDPTSGSGTTAAAAEKWGRRWIAIDTSRVALSLARTRIMAGRYPYYLLADSPEGRQKTAELSGRPVADSGPPRRDVRAGFVIKEQPRISPSTIGNNPDLAPGMSAGAAQAAIRRHAGRERIVDQPYEDNRIVRVAGPFTVESLSPHRNLDIGASEASDAGFAEMVLENLATAGVQNRVREQRLDFVSVEPFPGRSVHARGQFRDEEGEIRQAAITIGPEYGTVGSRLVRDAAKEALRGSGVDLLLVCGFAFDAHVGDVAAQIAPAGETWAIAQGEQRFGRLRVLLVRMNTDLTMGRDLLKKTGAANLFTVFGEPDVDLRRRNDGLLEVELRGVNVYDPTTGEVRSDTTAGVACWLVDTDYNGESFFVRHAYFSGSGDPYERLRLSLGAEIDPDAWASLYATISRPFDAPAEGRVAVKVINHHGDDVMKVFDLGART